MKKMHSCRGETLVESLCAILVLTVVFLFLCAIAPAAPAACEPTRLSVLFSA